MDFFDLFRPGFRKSDPRKRLKAVQGLHDEALLAEIARTDPDPAVRLAAVQRIRDEEHLLAVAMDGKEMDARIAAVQRISSQERLAAVIKRRRNLELMGACFARITDRDVLAAIARDPEYNITARRIAFENFADESFLSDVAAELNPERTAPSGAVDEAAVEAILRQYGGVRVVKAIGKFRGSEKALRALGGIARKGGEAGEAAVEYLARALGYANPALRACAQEELCTLRDPELVAALVRQLDDPALREPIRAVLEKIDTPEARAALGREEG